MAELPSGTVTFLFTDLEASTRLRGEHPDAMRDAAARHDELLRGAIESHDGHVVKTTGDGLHAAFGTADAGLVAAVAAQRLSTVRSGRCRSRCGCGWFCTRVRLQCATATISVRR